MDRTLRMPMDTSIIIDSALKLAGGALGVKLLDHYILKRKAKKEVKQKDEFLASLKDISAMNSYMSDVIDNTPADRFLILMGHDSGNIPNPKHPYYAKAMWQKIKVALHSPVHDSDSLIRRFDSIRVDFEYINMVIELMTKGSVKLVVDEMPNCFLKTIYKGEGIKYSEVYFLAQEKSSKIYYCSIATAKEDERFDGAEDRGKIELAVNHIRQIFSKV